MTPVKQQRIRERLEEVGGGRQTLSTTERLEAKMLSSAAASAEHDFKATTQRSVRSFLFFPLNHARSTGLQVWPPPDLTMSSTGEAGTAQLLS